jgi:hypothetical protein
MDFCRVCVLRISVILGAHDHDRNESATMTFTRIHPQQRRQAARKCLAMHQALKAVKRIEQALKKERTCHP